MMERPDITVSIVNTNNRELVLQCLTSLYTTAGVLNLEVFVVNNACIDGSTDAILRKFPQVKIIEHSEMLGFSTNNNLVFSQAKGRYLMLLNDDTIICPGAFQTMVTYMDLHPDTGVVGANLLNVDGTMQACYSHSPHPLYEGLQPLSEILYPLPMSKGMPLEVANVCGACMLVRASVVSEIGYLDPLFDPLYSEEIDWCFRFKKSGWKVYHLPEAQVIHLEGTTMNRSPIGRYERIFEKKAIFYRKHYGWGTLAVYKTTLLLSNLIKSIAWGILWGMGKKDAGLEVKTHWNMARRALFI